MLRLCGIAVLGAVVAMLIGELGFKGRRLISLLAIITLLLAVGDGLSQVVGAVTDFGNVDVVISPYLSADEVLVYNPMVCAPVEMNVPGKGNFFYEPLAKTGAAERGQIFGQIGLDYGPEWFHGKFVVGT